MLIIRHPDGSEMHLPEWMTRLDAGLLEIRDVPRISLRALSDLREFIAPLLLTPNESRTGERGERKTSDGCTRRAVSSETPVDPADGRATGSVDPASFRDPGGGNDNPDRRVRQPDDHEDQP